jgi:hypothetical protein
MKKICGKFLISFVHDIESFLIKKIQCLRSEMERKVFFQIHFYGAEK